MCPAFRRPNELKRLAESWERYCPQQVLHVRLTKDEPYWTEYDAYTWPTSWNFYVSEAQTAGAAIQEFAERHRGDAIGWVSDDLVVRTEDAPGILASAAGDWFLSWPNDGFQRWFLPTHFCVGPRLIEALNGIVVPSDFPHHYMDNRLKVIADNCGLARYLPDVYIEHITHFNGKAGVDAVQVEVGKDFQAATWRWEEYQGKLVQEIEAIRMALLKEFA
jgi:hypothetical protein